MLISVIRSFEFQNKSISRYNLSHVKFATSVIVLFWTDLFLFNRLRLKKEITCWGSRLRPSYSESTLISTYNCSPLDSASDPVQRSSHVSNYLSCHCHNGYSGDEHAVVPCLHATPTSHSSFRETCAHHSYFQALCSLAHCGKESSSGSWLCS